VLGCLGSGLAHSGYVQALSDQASDVLERDALLGDAVIVNQAISTVTNPYS
jgi:hypothetical protein